MKLTKEDEHIIGQCIRLAHGDYIGPVGIGIDRLVVLHMAYSRMIVSMAIVTVRYESKGSKPNA